MANEEDAQLIDQRLEEMGDWRGETLIKVRALIKKAVPDVQEELKWKKPSNAMSGVPVWSHNGIICTGEHYRDKVKLTFAKGASLPDPKHLFNSSLDGGTRRAIDIFQDTKLDEAAFVELIKAAADANTAAKQKKK